MYGFKLRTGLFALVAAWTTAQGAVLTPVSPAPAGATEGIVFEPNTGNYVITYEAEDEIRPKGLYQTIYVPATKIDPTVRFRLEGRGLNRHVAYRYTIKNGKNSQQNLRAIIISASNVEPGLDTPAGWNGSRVPTFDDTALRIGWSYAGHEDLGGLAPGKTLDGFGFSSNDLPGVGLIQLRGATPIQAYAGDGPSQELADEIAKLDNKNFVVYPAAVPRIRVDKPYDGAAVLDRLRAHVKKDIIELNLIESVLASQLDRSLQAAAEAIRRDQIKAARDHLHEAFKLIHQAYPNLSAADKGGDAERGGNKVKTLHPIDRLAARVIAFDIKYVERRLKGEER